MHPYVKAREFLNEIYTRFESTETHPFVTLTFAQSLDGKIAKHGKQLILSGPESMAMTHRLRLIHDAILVGIGTVLVDNPQLNARLVPEEDLKVYQQPIPIVLDTRLRLPLDCKLLTNYRNGVGRQPWVVTTHAYAANHQEAVEALYEAGAEIITVVCEQERPTFQQTLSELRRRGIHTLMVEGGAQVIQSCLSLADRLIVTTAPTWVGSGVTATSNTSLPQDLDNVQYQAFGRDMVLSATLARKNGQA